MGILTINAIPFNSDDATELKGHVVGERKVDQTTGYEYQLVKVATALIGDAWADGQVIVSKTAGTYEGTNDISEGIDATYPITLGIGVSAQPESTASITYYAWVLKRGYHATVVTNGDDDIAAGNLLFPSADKVCDSLAGSATNTADGVLLSVFGRAAAADVDAANTVAAYIDARF